MCSGTSSMKSYSLSLHYQCIICFHARESVSHELRLHFQSSTNYTCNLTKANEVLLQFTLLYIIKNCHSTQNILVVFYSISNAFFYSYICFFAVIWYQECTSTKKIYVGIYGFIMEMKIYYS